MLVPSSIEIVSISPRNTAPYQILTSFFKTTSPVTIAVGAIQTLPSLLTFALPKE